RHRLGHDSGRDGPLPGRALRRDQALVRNAQRLSRLAENARAIPAAPPQPRLTAARRRTPLRSFLRNRESRTSPHEFAIWVPAFAGTSGVEGHGILIQALAF